MTPFPGLTEVLHATTLETLRSADPHEVIIVGAGAAGGLAAMLLAESGLRVLVLDAGPPSMPLRAPIRKLAGRVVRRLSTPQYLNHFPPALIPVAREAFRVLGRWRQPVQSLCYAWERAPYAFVDDRESPYVTASDRPFVWVRTRTLGGRLSIPGHGQQYYRLGPDDFNPSDGLSSPWPLQSGELDQWYALVERRLGLSGMQDKIPWLPDSELTNFLSPSQTEATLRDKMIARWPGSRPILSRYAAPIDALEAAARTGRLRCRQGAIVREILVDSSGSVRGVAWIDHQTGTEQQSSAPLVFLCASALESTRLLMLSRSQRSPNGLGGASSALGNYLMDHVHVSAEGVGLHKYLGPTSERGRCLYLPRFDARELASPNPGRGYGIQVYRFPVGGSRTYFTAGSFAEMAPRIENRVTLDPEKRDAWGIPVLRIDCAHSEAELARAREQTRALQEIAELADVRLTRIDEAPRPPGSAFHECGTARMGTDPSNSVLDGYNQCWDARGLYLTDGACFPSQGFQNPTLTILALTARACQHALNGMRHKPPQVLEACTGSGSI
jgi:choline dehydrogenase-like flavoprotein